MPLKRMLPVELLTIISSLVHREGLPALALTDKRMNQIATPYLYAELDFFTYASAEDCLTTLNCSPATLFLPGRVLAEYVQSFRFRPTCLQYNPGMTNNLELLGQLLASIVPRMINLRDLDISASSLVSSSEVFAALVTNPHPRLELMKLCVFGASQSATTPKNLWAILPHGHTPRLQVIAIFSQSRLSLQNAIHLRALLSSTHSSLRRLTLAMDQTSDLRAVFPQDVDFPVLEHLEVTIRDFNDPVCTALTHIRSLAIRNNGFTLRTPRPVVSTAYPALEELACLHSHVPLFLSPDISPRRPIHTVALDYTTYEPNGGETTEDTPRWKDVFRALEHLQFSAVPIRHLRFYVSRLLVPELQAAMSEFPAMESLTMVVWHEPKRDALFALGECVFARLPRLHTFLLGDVVKKHHDHRAHFWCARDVALQRELLAEYGTHTSALRRVAFTTEFEWEKGGDGQWYTTDPVDPEVTEEPDSDDDTDSDFDSNGSDDDDSDSE